MFHLLYAQFINISINIYINLIYDIYKNSPSVKEIDKKIKEIIEDTAFNNNIDIELGNL